MKHAWRMTLAILRKDVQQLWPLAILAMILLTAYVALQGVEVDILPNLIDILLPVVASFAICLLVGAIIQTDAPASIHQDWLTRPVPRGALVVAKAIFIVTVLLLPSVVGETIASIRADRPWGEVLLVATTLQWHVVVSIVGICVVAALTSSLLEGAVLAVGMIVLTMILAPLMLAMSGTGEEIYMSGASWLAEKPREFFGAAMGAALLWLMYTRRQTQRARVLFFGGIGLLLLSTFMTPWPVVFAAQKRLSAEPAAERGFTLEPDGACLSAIVVNPPSAVEETKGDDTRAWAVGAPVDLQPTLWSESWRRSAGADAIGFETRVLALGVPQGWRVHLARIDAAYLNREGRTVHPLRPARFSPSWRKVDSNTRAASHFWLLSRKDFAELATQEVRLELDYAVSLLAPVRTTELTVDGQRRKIEGFGYCGAEFDAANNTMTVDCFQRGPQPAQLIASLINEPAEWGSPSNYPDYTPDVFELADGARHVITLRNVPRSLAERVRITSFEDRAHFDRPVTIDGVLGASATACPPPGAVDASGGLGL